ncbi:MAG: iron ABC transporter permease [Clostridia bacterium]|nr:iron ABC transporter permease [Clostridia bacterium]
MKKAGYRRLIILLMVLIIGLAILAMCVGRYSMNPGDVFNVFGARMNLCTLEDQTMDTVVFRIRLPRIIAALLIGAMLSMSGAVYQGVFRNPLVSPDLLGVSGGACVGAAAAILLGMGMAQRQLLAFLGGMLAVFLSTIIPRILRNGSNLMLVLSGIIVSGFMTSLLGILKFVAEEQTELSAIVFWQMGSLQDIKPNDALALLPVFLIGAGVMIALSWRINILSFGETEAKTLGMNVKRMRTVTIACASLLTATAVCVCGTIGWIGLVIPHLGRLIVGADHTRMLPTAGLLGGLFLLVIDTIARAASTVEIPLSILTGIIGAPFYAWLLYRQRARVS